MNKQKKWTEREVEILKELYPKEDVSLEDLERVFHRERQVIAHKVGNLHLKKEVKDNIDEEYLEQLRKVIRI